jgi:hypothetical protein
MFVGDTATTLLIACASSSLAATGFTGVAAGDMSSNEATLWTRAVLRTTRRPLLLVHEVGGSRNMRAPRRQMLWIAYVVRSLLVGSFDWYHGWRTVWHSLTSVRVSTFMRTGEEKRWQKSVRKSRVTVLRTVMSATYERPTMVGPTQP